MLLLHGLCSRAPYFLEHVVGPSVLVSGFHSPGSGITIYRFNHEPSSNLKPYLLINMSEAARDIPSTLTSFTLCLRFNITNYNTQDGVLVSYALSSVNDNFLQISVNDYSSSVKYAGEVFRLKTELQPLWWYNLCFLVSPHEQKLCIDSKCTMGTKPRTHFFTNGSLVLGQDQDNVGGGFSDMQSFHGEVTDFNFWCVALQDLQVKNWSLCQPVELLPCLNWEDLPWNYEIMSKELASYVSDGCYPGRGMNKHKLLLFSEKKTWDEAFNFLQSHGFEFMVPNKDQEVYQVSKHMAPFTSACRSAYMTGYYAWLGIKSDFIENWNVNTNESVSCLSMISEKSLYLRRSYRGILYMMQSNDNTWYLEYPHTKLCFVGVQTSLGSIYKLKGSPLEECLKMHFIIRTDRGYFEFYSGHGMVIQQENGTWTLRVMNNAVATTKTNGLPLGRRAWLVKFDSCGSFTNETKPMVLTLSSCKGYTCTDGKCIIQHQRCNQIYDCQDGSDEKDCHTAEAIAGQIMFGPPPNPLYFHVEIRLKNFGAVDILAMRLYIDFALTVTWKDVRLQYRNLPINDSAVRLSTLNELQAWHPKVIVENSPDVKEYDATSVYIVRGGKGTVQGNDTIYTGHDNHLRLTLRVQTAVYCNFHLRRYPWDRHNCYAKVHFFNSDKRSLLYNKSSSITYNLTRNLGAYDLESYTLDITNGSNIIFLVIKLRQRPDNILWIVYLPTTFLLGIGYGTLFLPVDRFAERGGMSLTTLLVLISLYTDMASNLPNTTYLKLIDIWFVFSIIYLSIIITVHLVTCRSTTVSLIRYLRVPKPDTICKKGKAYICNSALMLTIARYFFGIISLLFFFVYFSIVIFG